MSSPSSASAGGCLQCSRCLKPISGTFVRAFGMPWHDTCFLCGRCGMPIRDAKYASEKGVPYHGECLAMLRGEVCFKCGKPITGTVTTALNEKWHPDCFTCGLCNLPILTSQFSSRDGIAYHIHCQLPTELTPARPCSPARRPCSPCARPCSPP
eukprot:RCo028517